MKLKLFIFSIFFNFVFSQNNYNVSIHTGASDIIIFPRNENYNNFDAGFVFGAKLERNLEIKKNQFLGLGLQYTYLQNNLDDFYLIDLVNPKDAKKTKYKANIFSVNVSYSIAKKLEKIQLEPFLMLSYNIALKEILHNEAFKNKDVTYNNINITSKDFTVIGKNFGSGTLGLKFIFANNIFIEPQISSKIFNLFAKNNFHYLIIYSTGIGFRL